MIFPRLTARCYYQSVKIGVFDVALTSFSPSDFYIFIRRGKEARDEEFRRSTYRIFSEIREEWLERIEK